MRIFARVFGLGAVEQINSEIRFTNCPLCGVEKVRVYTCGGLDEHVVPERGLTCDGKKQEKIVTKREKKRLRHANSFN